MCAVGLAGVTIGVAAWALKWLIKEVAKLVSEGLDPDGSNFWLIALPVMGILLVGLFVRKVVRLPLEGVVKLLKADIASGNGKMPSRLIWASPVACALTLGFGGSGGAESPIAYSGAAISSNIARWLRVDEKQLTAFVSLGAGAGIAAIFKSPVGGFFYILEILRMKLDNRQVLMGAAMCLIAYLTAYSLSGFTLILPLRLALPFSWNMLPVLVLLGVATGLYAFYYESSGLMVRRTLHRVKRPVMRNLASGLMIGLGLCLFPALYGEGYAVLDAVVHGGMESVAEVGMLNLFHGHDLIIWSFVGILALKGMAVYASNSGGGVVGDFTPTLFAGGMLGAFASVLFPEAPVPQEVMVLCGMCAGMAGITRAPLMAIFIVVEMTGEPQLFLPVSVVALTAFLSSKLLRERVTKSVLEEDKPNS